MFLYNSKETTMLNPIYIDRIIRTALDEDLGYMDQAGDLLPVGKPLRAYFQAKDDGVLCGMDIARQVFHTLNSEIRFTARFRDGDSVKTGDVLALIEGDGAHMLMGERVSLNFLQHMSGIATYTRKCVAAVAETGCRITDTRKTLPGLRALQKYAVRCGGGRNHRFNLSDAVMIKDNHIDACGGITQAVAKLRQNIGHMTLFEVEVRNLDELSEALQTKAPVIMLDNMSLAEMAQAVKITDHRAVLEASGQVTLGNIRDVALTGVDVISLGALTHSVKALDVSMKIEK
jgi:nicotinate-nucleotide pyrophosphorylase (carboxylating)